MKFLVTTLLILNFNSAIFCDHLCQLSFDKVKASCGQKDYKPIAMQTYKGIQLSEDEFGCFNDSETGTSQVVRRFTLTNENGLSVQIINYGGIITSIKAPDGNKQIDDLVLGFDDIKGYLDKNNPYFGAIIGRVANRIANASFTLSGKEYHVGNNGGDGSYTLHGGFRGFDKYLWEPFVEDNKLTLSRVSKDGEEGFPGDVLVQAIYQLTNDNELILELKSTSSKPTPINLCNHAYFNLAGHKTGAKGIYEHIATINADRYTVTNEMIIPTGEIASVEGTILDLRSPSLLGDKIPQVPGGGYDHNLCVIQSDPNGINLVARVVHPESKRYLEVRSNQPGVQFYTSNSLPNNTLIGKDGVTYETHGAFCLETQNYPNAINIPTFPNSVLNPGDNYYHIVIYKFGIEADTVKGK